MSNFPLVTIEGSGNFNPAGTVVNLVPTLPRVFEADGILYSRDNTPGRVIPDFDTKVPEFLKGRVNDFTKINFIQAAELRYSGAAISSTGTIIRVLGTKGSTQVTIDRLKTGEAQFTTVYTSNTTNNNSAATVSKSLFVVSGTGGKWCVASGGHIFTSLDDGNTWKVNPVDVGGTRDLRVGSGDVLLLVAAPTAASTTYTIYRSTDFGLTWIAVNSQGCVTLTSTTGNNWVGLLPTTSTIQSSDNGVTWTAGPTSTVSVNFNAHIVFTSGRYYVRYGTNIATGTALTSLSTLPSISPVAIGVDASGNCVAVTNSGIVHRSVAGSGFVPLDYRAGRYALGGSDYSTTLSFANGIWCDRGGSFITNTDLVANNKSWTSWETLTPFSFGEAQGKSRVGHYDSTSGVAIIMLNYNSYLRSTDKWDTWELRNFNVSNRTALDTDAAPRGIACDGFGNWVALFNSSSNLYYSTDNGLTWVSKVSPATSGVDVVGGGGSGCFYIKQSAAGGGGKHTNNGFITSTTIANPATTMIASNAIYLSNGLFVDMVQDAGVNTLWITVVNASTGAKRDFSLDFSVKGSASTDFGIPLNAIGSTVYLGSSQIIVTGLTTLNFTPSFFFTSNSWVMSETGAVVDGVLISSPWQLQLGPYTIMPTNTPNSSYSFTSEGIANFSLTASQFLKVT